MGGAVLSVLLIPVAAAMLLLLPALTPLLALAPLVTLASLPWWLHLPLTGKPLLIPLALLFVPAVLFFALVSLSLLPAVLIVLIPIFCLIPALFASALPLLSFCHTVLGLPLLSYATVPAWLSVNWTWPLPQFQNLLEQIKTARKDVAATITPA